MANSIQAAPSVLADGVIASLSNKLPVLRSFSRVFTSTPQASGKTIQVPLIGTSTATEFGASGNQTLSGVISGAGALTQNAASTLQTAQANMKAAELPRLVKPFRQADLAAKLATGAEFV